MYSENCESGSGFKVNKDPGFWNWISKRGSGSWEVWVGGIENEINHFGGILLSVCRTVKFCISQKETYYYNWMNMNKLFQFT